MQINKKPILFACYYHGDQPDGFSFTMDRMSFSSTDFDTLYDTFHHVADQTATEIQCDPDKWAYWYINQLEVVIPDLNKKMGRTSSGFFEAKIDLNDSDFLMYLTIACSNIIALTQLDYIKQDDYNGTQYAYDYR